jgi:hypothetical protein
MGSEIKKRKYFIRVCIPGLTKFSIVYVKERWKRAQRSYCCMFKVYLYEGSVIAFTEK